MDRAPARFGVVLLAACVPATPGKGTSGADTGRCDAATAALGWDDDTAFGTPRALADAAAFSEDPTFGYADGAATGLHLALTADGGSAPTGATLLGGDLDCTVAREVRVPLRLALETADGAFLLDAPVELVATDAGVELRGPAPVDAAAHGGAFDAEGWDELRVAVVAWAVPTAGEVVLLRGAEACGVGAWNLGTPTGCP